MPDARCPISRFLWAKHARNASTRCALATKTRGFFPGSLRAPVRVRGFEIRLERCDAFQPAAVTRADYGGRKSRHNRLVGGGSNSCGQRAIAENRSHVFRRVHRIRFRPRRALRIGAMIPLKCDQLGAHRESILAHHELRRGRPVGRDHRLAQQHAFSDRQPETFRAMQRHKAVTRCFERIDVGAG